MEWVWACVRRTDAWWFWFADNDRAIASGGDEQWHKNYPSKKVL
jgi:hypothetical protein